MSLFEAGSLGVTSALQLLVVIILAPGIQGIIKKVKARLQRRQGPPLLQTYADLAKYFAKAEVISEHASWITQLTPLLVFGCMGTAALFLPLIGAPPLGGAADILLLIALFALARVFTALAGLDAGGAFGGIGSSREMMVAVIVEPALLLVVCAVALRAGTTNLGQIVTHFVSTGITLFTPSHLLAAFACSILVIAETGRLPVDNPDTHLELTMIHEGMLLEYSGRSLALMLLASAMKQLLVISLFVNLFFPWGIATTGTLPMLLSGLVFYLIKVIVVAIMLGVVEMLIPKYRLFRLPSLMLTAFLAAFLAIISAYILR